MFSNLGSADSPSVVHRVSPLKPFLALISLAIPFGIGLTAMRLAGPWNVHPALAIGAAFGIGFALVGWVIGGLSVLRIPLLPEIGISVVLFLWIVALVFAYRVEGVPGPWVSWSRVVMQGYKRWLWWLGIVGLGLVVLVVIFRAMVKPMMGWDALIVHTLRAKVMFYDRGISLAALEWIGRPDYPLGLPLAELWTMWFQGTWDDVALKVLFPGFFAALLAMMYGGLREVAGPLAALSGTWLLAGLPFVIQHATDAFLDLPLAYATLGVSIGLWRYGIRSDPGDLVMASLMGGLAVWTKNEGVVTFALALAALVGWTVCRQRLLSRSAWADIARFGVWPLTVWLVWEIVKTQMTQSGDLHMSLGSLLDHADRVPAILALTSSELWGSANWNVLWPLFFGGWLLHIQRSLTPACFFFAWPVLLAMVVFLAVSEATIMYRYLLEGSTLHRMMLHVAPLAAFWVALMLNDRLDDPQKSQKKTGGGCLLHRPVRITIS